MPLARTIAVIVSALALMACSDPEEPVAEPSPSPELTAIVEAVAAEVHEALGVADRIDVLGSRTEACTNAFGNEDGTVQVVLGSRLVNSDLDPSQLDDAASALGATDIRGSDLEDPLDPGTPTGRQVSIFAQRDGTRVDVTLHLEAGDLTATYRTTCN